MRGRSSTISRTRTRSVSFSARLALTTKQYPLAPSLESLPTEILLQIIQTAAAVPRPSKSASDVYRLGSSHFNDSDDEDRHASDYFDFPTLLLASMSRYGSNSQIQEVDTGVSLTLSVFQLKAHMICVSFGWSHGKVRNYCCHLQA